MLTHVEGNLRRRKEAKSIYALQARKTQKLFPFNFLVFLLEFPRRAFLLSPSTVGILNRRHNEDRVPFSPPPHHLKLLR